jgi:signal transduction histidine kinase
VRTVRLALVPAGLALGVAAEWAAGRDASHWVPDLVVGWAFLACGLVAWSKRAESRSGALMVATGGAWFAGTFFDQLVYLHRGPLVHLVLAYPRGRLRGRFGWTAAALAYGTAVSTEVWQNEGAAIGLSAAFVAVACRGYLGAVGRERRERLASLSATAAVAFVFTGLALAQLVLPIEDVKEPGLLAYEAALGALAVALTVALLRAPWERLYTDLVVELGEERSDSLRDALAAALGDPTLEVGYWSQAAGAYVDAAGVALDPETGNGRSLTRIDRDGERVAVLVHDRAVLDDPGLLEAVGTASRLAATNAQLQAEVRARVAELEASRRRLVESRDRERLRLEQRLHDGAEEQLAALSAVLARARERAPSSETAQRIDSAAQQLERTEDELRGLARGLHPRSLSELGLRGALRSLAQESRVPVDLSLPTEALSGPVEAAVYFVCSEALANVAKYAAASRASVAVAARDGRVCVEIRDDGVGGADPARGTGLAGLADRVESLGGTFRVVSQAGEGTRVVAEIPLA